MRNFIYILSFPFIWIFRKLINGIKYFKENFYKITLVNLPNFFILLFGYTLILYSFTNLKEDTTFLTNYGFAILVGVASICFSWVRSLDKTSEPKMISRLNKYGEYAVHAAIIFLLGSVVKYMALHLDILFNLFMLKQWITPRLYVQIVMSSISSLCFTQAFIKANFSISGINLLLYERLHLGEKN